MNPASGPNPILLRYFAGEESLEAGDAITLQQLPVGDLAPELRDLRLGHLG